MGPDAAMKWLFLGCFSGRKKEAAKPTRRPAQPLAATASSPQNDTVVATSADTSQPSAKSQQSQDPCAGGPVLFRPHAGSETKAQAPSGTSNECVDATGSQAQGEAVQRTAPIQKSRSAEQQEAPAPRLSLDCGVGVGPRPPEPPQSAPPPSSELSFVRLPPPSAPLALMVRGSVDTGSGDTGAESSFVISDGSSGALAVRGGAAAAALVGPPGDLMVAALRHPVSRALRGRASLDAMLMLGALVRAADEAGLAVTAIGGTSRLERIESGDLPPGEDGHQDRQTSSRQSRQSRQLEAAAKAAAAAGAAVAMPGPRPEWYADAETAGSRLAPRPQRRGMRWQQAALYGSGVSGRAAAAGSSGSGAADAAVVALGFGGGSEALASHIMSGAAAAALGRSGDPDFTFSPPTVANSIRQSVDTSRGQHSDLSLGLLPQAAAQFDGQVADSNQVLELFMRLVTNCSTVGDNDLPSTSSGADRSSAGTATCVVTGAGGTTGTGYGSRPVTGTGFALVGGAPVPVSVHRRSRVQRSFSERHRYHNGRRWGGADGGGAAAAGAAGPSHTAAAAAAGLHSQEGGSSAPLMKLHNRHLMFGGGSAGGGGCRRPAAAGARRNSWDTLAGSSSSAVAVAAAAAAALAAAGLLHGSVASSRNTGGGGGAAGAAGCCSNSGKTATGSASRFWPVGGVLQEDSGPASLLLVGALSGGMSVGGTTSATSFVQLPTGSGSVRDVLSRIHQQQQQQQQHEGGIPATSSGSWSAQTGLASLFDAHLTAALRRNGAVLTFKRALGGPAALSHASSGVSQQMGNLGRQDTSLSLTSGLMMLNFGSTAGSSGGAGGAGSCNGIGVSHLGAASAAAAGGLLGSGLIPPRVRRATISSISTIHSSAEAGTAPGGQDHHPGGRCGADGVDGEDIPPVARDAMAGSAMTAPPAIAADCRVHLLSDESGGAGIQESRAQLLQQPRAFVERQHPQHPLNPHTARHLQPNSAQAAGTRQQEHAEGPQAKMQLPRGPVLLGSAAAAAVALPPSGYEERGSLSLALGLAAGVHGSAGSIVVNTPSGASPAAIAAAFPVGNRGGAGDALAAAAGPLAAGSMAAGPVGAPWLQPQGPGGALGRGTTGAELSASLGFSRYSWETDWGPPAAGATRGPETFTFTGPSSFSHGRTESAALREAGPDNGGPA